MFIYFSASNLLNQDKSCCKFMRHEHLRDAWSWKQLNRPLTNLSVGCLLWETVKKTTSIDSWVKLTWLWSLKDSRISSPKVASYSQPACQGRKAGRQRSGERPPLEEASLAPIERLHNCCTNWHLGTGCILHGATVFIADTMSWTNLASTFPIVPRVRLAQWNKPSEMDVVLYS